MSDAQSAAPRLRRLTQAQVWNALAAVEPELFDYSPVVSDDPVAWHLQAELGKGGQPLAERLVRATRCMDEDARNPWLERLLRDRDGGILREAHGYGVLHQRGFLFGCPHTVSSAELYRAPSSTGAVEVELDGRFKTRDVWFDVKALTTPENSMRRLLDLLNKQLKDRGLFASVEGTVDFEHTVFGEQFGLVLRHVREQIEQGVFRVDVPDHDMRIKIGEATPGCRIAGENSYNPYRYAEQNCGFLLGHANQVPRDKPFLFVVVYSMATSSILAWRDTDTVERALARRLFVQLARSTDLCPNADGVATTGEVVQSIGGLIFIGLDHDTLRLYLNPNARDGQRITVEHVEQLTGAYSLRRVDGWDDFRYDNY
ncbi:MAG TPA: hypothetical protein DEA08_37465 [Planctomycetes bacterium]|nr:hypothetical protein [Planctomycetota bacterium]